MVYAKVVGQMTPQLAANPGFQAILEQMAFPPSAE
jgi:hypothetical protein